MLLELLSQGNVRDFLVSLILSLPIALFSLSLHETAHGFVAYKLGDPTAKNLGRLTLNPFTHIHPLGFLFLLLFGFGLSNPVPVNTRYFKKPKRDMALTALAGPLSNFLLAIVFALLLRLSYAGLAIIPITQTTLTVFDFLFQFLTIGIVMNITLAVFNLIPCPPLDGSRIFLVFLPSGLYFKVMRYERYLYLALVIALCLGLLDAPINYVSNLFLQLIYRLIF